MPVKKNEAPDTRAAEDVTAEDAGIATRDDQTPTAPAPVGFDLGINGKALFQPKRGTVFIAPENTELPADLSKLLISCDKEGAWSNLGHTSADNLPNWDSDGGDGTSKDSWLANAVRTTYEAKTVSVTVKSIQADSKTLKFIYNGWDTAEGKAKGIVTGLDPAPRDIALVVVSYDPGTNSNYGTYMPSASMKADGMPDLSGDFAEFGFKANAQSSDILPTGPNGQRGAFVFLPPDYFNN